MGNPECGCISAISISIRYIDDLLIDPIFLIFFYDSKARAVREAGLLVADQWHSEVYECRS